MGGGKDGEGAGVAIPKHLRKDWPLLRLLVDQRVNLDPLRAGELPATFVVNLNAALDLMDYAERKAYERVD